MKMLITGASGYVGSSVYKFLKNKNLDVTGLYKNNKLFDELIYADLTSKESIKEVVAKVKPDVIIHTAADAHTNTCEQNPDYARRLNVEGTRNMVDLCMENNIRLIYVSTFGCFNKNKDSVYLKTKSEAEEIVKTLNNYVVVRLSIAMGTSPNSESSNFYNDLLKSSKLKNDFIADSDWKFEISYLKYVNEALEKIIGNKQINETMIPLIVHGETSRYEIARRLLTPKGLNVVEVKSNRIIPPIIINEDIYERFGLQRHSLDEAIASMTEEMK